MLQTIYEHVTDETVRLPARVDFLYQLKRAVGRKYGMLMQTPESRNALVRLARELIDSGVAQVNEELSNEPPYRISRALDRIALGAFASDLARHF